MTDTERKEFLSKFGKRVKKLRADSGMTLEEVASKIGYTTENCRSSVQKIEAGKSDLPASKVYKLSQIFQVPVGYLMGLHDEFNQAYDTEKPEKEVSLLEQIQNQYGKSVTDAFSLYIQLDPENQWEIRGEMKQILKGGKYLPKDEPILNAAHAIEGASEDDIQHDEDIMDSEDF